jgi:hypothetical protein
MEQNPYSRKAYEYTVTLEILSTRDVESFVLIARNQLVDEINRHFTGGGVRKITRKEVVEREVEVFP